MLTGSVKFAVLFRNIRERYVLPYALSRLFSNSDGRNNEANKALESSVDDSDFELDDSSQEEIEKKRNKARMNERVYRVFVKKECLPPESEYDFQLKRLKARYGKYGERSGLNPGLMWPTQEKLLEMITHDEMFHRPLQEMLSNVQAAELEEQRKRKEVEDTVEKNMANLDKWMQEYYSKIAKKEAIASELKIKRERLIEEISDYLGYDVDPADPKFKEAVEQKEKEKKKALKERKQQESYNKMLQKLSEIADGNN